MFGLKKQPCKEALALVKSDKFIRDAQARVLNGIAQNKSLDEIQDYILRWVIFNLIPEGKCSANQAADFWAANRAVIDPLVNSICEDPFRCYSDPSYLLKKVGFTSSASGLPQELFADAAIQAPAAAEKLIGGRTYVEVTEKSHPKVKVLTPEEYQEEHRKRKEKKKAPEVQQ